MPTKMLFMRFYVKQQEVCLPFVHGIPLKLRGQVLHSKSHSYLHEAFSQAMLLFSDNACNLRFFLR